MNPTLLWLRAESKAFEERTLLTPDVARQLVEAGYQIKVEHSDARCFPDEDYAHAGCELVVQGSWRQAPAEAIILGLKELDADLGPFVHRHVQFAHVYKRQSGWQHTLNAFTEGGGTLYDLEFLVDEQGRRVAAFGYWAGFVGAAMAVLAWCGQQLGRQPSLSTLGSWADREALVSEVRNQLQQALSSTSPQIEHHQAIVPEALVIGALGRCGRGACELLEACGIASTRWDMAETAGGGPFHAVLEHDLLINCVFVNSPSPPFTTMADLASADRRLSVISDVSCDPSGDYNPLPIYTECTGMNDPVRRLLPRVGDTPALDLIAIDHLPSLLPRESSEDFSNQLLPHLRGLDRLDQGVWSRAAALFGEHAALAASASK